MKRQKEINWTELIVGVVCILIGVYTFTRPQQALNGFAVAYGILAIIMGIADIAFYINMERHTGFGPVIEIISGILNIFIGFFLIVYSHISVLIASIFFAVWIIAHSIGRLINVGIVKFYEGKTGYYTALIINIIGLVLGLLMLFSPFASVVSIAFIIALYLIAFGIGNLISVFFTKTGRL